MESIFRVWSDSFAHMQRIPERFAFEKIDPSGVKKTVPASNWNPAISWSTPPQGTKSLVLLCEDHDVPADFSQANQPDQVIPEDAPRTSFVHWVLIDISSDETCIDAGTLSKGIKIKGKRGPACANGMRQGLNDYTKAFEGDPEMEGNYYGYDGPCPPWNDERIHNYEFTVYALDLIMLPLEGSFSAEEVKKAMEGHILGKGTITGTYTLNAKLATH